MEIPLKWQQKDWVNPVLQLIQGDAAYRREHKISKAFQQRIKSLLDLALRVDRMLKEVPSTGWTPDDEAFEPVREAMDDLNRRMAKYPSIYYIDYNSRCILPFYFSEKSTTPSIHEGISARYIFDLTKEGLISNIRECICGTLFWASRADQKSHSPACKQKRYEQTEEGKRKRREYMRENYKLHKEGRVKEK